MYRKKIYETRELLQLALDDGWYFDSQTGSHRYYKHPVKTGKMTIVMGRKTAPPKTSKRVLSRLDAITL